MITARALPRQGRAALLAAVIVLAALVRATVGGARPAASAPAAALFAVVLITLWLAARWRSPAGGRGNRLAAVAVGVAGGSALVALSLLGGPALLVKAQAPLGVLLWWAPVVTLVAVAEELALRGALFDAVRGRAGDAPALLVTSVLFAVIHLPLYGLGSLGVNLAAGVFLGSLRLITGGVIAPVVAHVAADVATGWMP